MKLHVTEPRAGTSQFDRTISFDGEVNLEVIEMKTPRWPILVLMFLLALCVCIVGTTAPAIAEDSLAASSTEHPEAILWFFLGINGALMGLALVIRKNMAYSGPAREAFVASCSFRLGSTLGGLPGILEWLSDQVSDGKLMMSSVIELYNAIEDVSAYILMVGQANGVKENVKADIVIRKGTGSVNLSHTGPALSLAAYDPDDLVKGKNGELEGLELAMAKSQVDFLEYQATLSKDRHLFKIRKSLKKG